MFPSTFPVPDNLRAFLKAVHTQPDDDAPRLILADWLDEHAHSRNGYAARAEFIRVQCRLASQLLTPEQRLVLESHASTLVRRHRQDWEEPWRQLGARELLWSRGFPEAATLSGPQAVTAAAELLRWCPLRTLTLTHCPNAAALAMYPELQTLTALELGWNQLGDAAVAELAGSPHVQNLARLGLEANDLDPTAAVALAEQSHLGKLRSLGLDWNPLGDEGIVALAHAAILRRLRHLTLHCCQAGSEATQALATAGPLLTHLDLGANAIDSKGAQALAASPHMRELTQLDLHWNGIGEEGGRALLLSLRQGPMRRLLALELFANRMSPELLAEIGREMAARRQQKDAPGG